MIWMWLLQVVNTEIIRVIPSCDEECQKNIFFAKYQTTLNDWNFCVNKIDIRTNQKCVQNGQVIVPNIKKEMQTINPLQKGTVIKPVTVKKPPLQTVKKKHTIKPETVTVYVTKTQSKLVKKPIATQVKVPIVTPVQIPTQIIGSTGQNVIYEQPKTVKIPPQPQAVQQFIQIPAQTQVQATQSVQKPVQIPAQTQVQVTQSVQQPVQIPVQTQVQIPVQTQVQLPVQTPITVPTPIPVSIKSTKVCVEPCVTSVSQNITTKTVNHTIIHKEPVTIIKTSSQPVQTVQQVEPKTVQPAVQVQTQETVKENVLPPINTTFVPVAPNITLPYQNFYCFVSDPICMPRNTNSGYSYFYPQIFPSFVQNKQPDTVQIDQETVKICKSECPETEKDKKPENKKSKDKNELKNKNEPKDEDSSESSETNSKKEKKPEIFDTNSLEEEDSETIEKKPKGHKKKKKDVKEKRKYENELIDAHLEMLAEMGELNMKKVLKDNNSSSLRKRLEEIMDEKYLKSLDDERIQNDNFTPETDFLDPHNINKFFYKQIYNQIQDKKAKMSKEQMQKEREKRKNLKKE